MYLKKPITSHRRSTHFLFTAWPGAESLKAQPVEDTLDFETRLTDPCHALPPVWKVVGVTTPE
jgi:hypothetical protein